MGTEGHCASLPAATRHVQVHAENRMPAPARHEQVCTQDLRAGLPPLYQYVLQAVQDRWMPALPAPSMPHREVP